MPVWSEIANEISQVGNEKGHIDFDQIRRKYLLEFSKKRNRSVILYASNWINPTVTSGDSAINDDDLCGFMETIHGLENKNLDIILHSPGGSAESTEAIVNYIRAKFDNVHVFIPHSAMSAATILACSAEKIIMGKHSSIGPIDPQIMMPSQHGYQFMPASAILSDFKKAEDVYKNEQNKFGPYVPILNQYVPGLLDSCRKSQKLSVLLVSKWLQQYMFKDNTDAETIACRIAEDLSNYEELASHSRHLNFASAKHLELNVTELESNQEEQDLVLSIFHATNICFQQTTTVKIIENHLGKAYVKSKSKIV